MLQKLKLFRNLIFLLANLFVNILFLVARATRRNFEYIYIQK